MSFDAGKIEATADLDRSPFIRSLEQMRAEGLKLSRETFRPKLDADTTQATRKVRDTELKLEKISKTPYSAKLTIDNAKALLALEPVTARLDDINGRIATARVNAKTDEARSKLDEIKHRLDAIGRITSNPKVSLSGVATTNAQLDRLEARMLVMDRMSAGGGRGGSGGAFGAISQFGSHAPGALPLAAAAAVPLVAPVAGLAAGAAASFLTPLTAGGIGLAAFAATAKSSYTAISTDVKSLTADQLAYNKASTPAGRLAALKSEHLLWASLDPAQRKAVNNMHSLDGEWTSFQKKLQPQTFGALSKGLGLATVGLKLLLPVTRATGSEVNKLETSARHALTDPFWHQFFGSFLPGEATKALGSFGTFLGDVVTGLGHLAVEFAPLGHRLETDLVHVGGKFEAWTQGSGPGHFVAWVEKNGPPTVRSLEKLAGSVGKLLVSLDPLGQFELRAFSGVLTAIADLGDSHPAVLNALAGSLLAVAVAMKTAQGVSAAHSGIDALIKLYQILTRTAGEAAVAEEVAGKAGGGGVGVGGRGGNLLKGLGGDAAVAGEGAAAGSAAGGAASTFAGVAVPVVGGFLLYKLITDKAQAAKPPPAAVKAGFGQTFGIRSGGRAGGAPISTDPNAAADDASLAAQAKLLHDVAVASNKVSAAELNMGAVVAKVGTGSLSKASAAGRANRTALTGAAKSVKDYRAALVAAGTPLNQVQAKTKAYADSLLNQALATYGSKKQVDALLTSLHAMPRQVASKIAIEGVEGAIRGLSSIHAWLDLIHSKTVDVSVRRIATIQGPGHQLVNPPGGTSANTRTNVGNSALLSPHANDHNSGLGNFGSNAAMAGGGGGSKLPPWLTGGQHGSTHSPAGSGGAGSSGTQSGSGGSSGSSHLTADGSALRAALNAENKRLTGALGDLGRALTHQQSVLSNMRGLESSTSASFTALGDPGQFGSQTSLGQVNSILRAQNRLGSAFEHNLRVARRRGLDKKDYRALLAGGPVTDGNTAGLLAGATHAEIMEYERQERELRRSGAATGAASTKFLYGRSVGAEQHIVHALTSSQKQLTAEQAKIATALQNIGKNGDTKTHELLVAVHAEIAALNRTLSGLNHTPKIRARSHIAGAVL